MLRLIKDIFQVNIVMLLFKNNNLVWCCLKIYLSLYILIPARGDPYLSFFDFDVALVSLPKLFSFNEYVKPICLPINKIKAIDEIGKLNGKPLTISGFGRTTQSGEPTKILQFAKVLKQNSDECFHDVFGSDAQFPPKWAKMKKEGFCYKGENSEVCIDF